MAKVSKKVKTADKWRKKKFYPVFAPKLFQQRELGQAAAYEATTLLGRSLSLNLMVLTGNIKKQHINVTFTVNKVQGDSAYTGVTGYEMVAAAIKRKVRRHKDRVDDSFKAGTKDDKVVRIKPMVITVNKTSKAVRSDVRRHLKRFFLISIKKLDYETLINNTIIESIQREAKAYLNKITPLRSVDIRSLKFLGEAKKAPSAAVQTPGPAPAAAAQ